MSVQSETSLIYWVACDGCGDTTMPQVEDILAIEEALDWGWTTDGERHHCPECPPLQEVCS